MYASEWPEPGLSSTVEGRGRRADGRTGGRTNGRRTTTTASSAGMSDRRRARTGGGGGASIKMEHFQAALDPRKQELLEARFLGARDTKTTTH
ncbi:hypothetical protein quinque_015994 [Culex quinquefasciatus]